MADPARVARLLLETASSLANAAGARAIVVAVDALPELEAVPPRTVLVRRSIGDDAVVERLSETAHGVIEVPPVELDRLGQVKLAGIIALSSGEIALEDSVVFLTGPFRSIIDSLVVMTIGAEYELFDASEQPEVREHIKRAVFHRVLGMALEIGEHGREGRRTGALFVVGDIERVRAQSEQMILNPFKGYDESDRNVLDDRMAETIREFSTIDGAFLIGRTGVIESAGARILAGRTEGLPPGLGSRHATAAGITATTKAIAITVSATDGAVRVFRAGKLVATFDPPKR